MNMFCSFQTDCSLFTTNTKNKTRSQMMVLWLKALCSPNTQIAAGMTAFHAKTTKLQGECNCHFVKCFSVWTHVSAS